MRRNNRRSRSKPITLPEISLTPLIDTVLVLLVIFMVCMPVVQQAIKINLPQSGTGDARGKQEDIFVYLDGNKQLYVNAERVTEQTLVKTIQSKMKDSQKQFIFVNADKKLEYGELHDLFAKLKEGGITRVALSSRPKPRSA